MNRGSSCDSASGRYPDRAFNEAPIHESGKSTAKILDAHWIGAFNEAPIHESGKCGRRRWRDASRESLQ